MIPRLHLFEFEDLSWFPKLLRNYMTDFLEFITDRFDFYRPIDDVIETAVRSSGHSRIIDLASGGGGGMKNIAARMGKRVPGLKIVLTDLFPNIRAFERVRSSNPAIISYEEEGISALEVPKELKGLRTMFLSFHHFRPSEGRRILANAVEAKMPILIAEVQLRNPEHLIKNFFSPIFVLLTTPLIRPFRWSRLLLTYPIPLVPLATWWDGIVSVLRTYHTEELLQLASEADPEDDFTWESRIISQRGQKLIYLVGMSKQVFQDIQSKCSPFERS